MVDNSDLSINKHTFEFPTWAGSICLAVLLYMLWGASFKHLTNDRADAKPKDVPIAPTKHTCDHKMGGRNLIVCIDGTANQFGKKNTNVIELYNLILKEAHDNQRTWYNSGIGTYARPSWTSLNFYKQVLYHKIDLAIAWKFEGTVLAAYRWLSDNYKEGDCIFLFGFSRGAFQVRVLSAMIDKVGLIYKGNEMQIPFAYELYVDDEPIVTEVVTKEEYGPKPESPRGNRSQEGRDTSLAAHFKRTFSHKNVRVHFVGAWDTVSSIGIVREKKMLPGTVDGMTHVCYFRHALALDERRVKFLPEYAYGGTNKPEDNAASAVNPKSSKMEEVGNKSTEKKNPHTKEVWFAGTHSDIGGGNAENIGMNRSRPPLRWMVFEAGKVGLRTAPFLHDLSPEEQIEIEESLTWCWWPLEVIPLKHLAFTSGKHTIRWPHLGLGRQIHPGQKIHNSLVLASEANKYTPKARPPDSGGSFWKELNNEEGSKWLEIDMYEYVGGVIENFITKDYDTATMWPLRQIATGGDGRQSVYTGVIKALGKQRDTDLSSQGKHQLLSSAMDIVGKGCQHLKLEQSERIRPLVSDLLRENKAYQKTAQEFMAWFTDPILRTFRGQTGRVRTVIFSSDAKHIVFGSSDYTVRIWNVETQKEVGKLEGHVGEVWSVALSSGGRRVVSGSSDKTVRIWDVKTGKEVGEPLQGHTDTVWSVALSPDANRIVSGSSDNTVRRWDAEGGKELGEPLRGHTDTVMSVAFSSDGKRIVSGSSDKMVRIWNAETGEPLGEPLEGHTDSVESVAFSPDGKRVVSGSTDKTVRIWDVEGRKPVGKPLQGHTAAVWSVTFSSNCKRILSSSQDRTVRVWDAEGGNMLREPLRGHRGGIQCVVFSTNDKRIASGSEDGTLRIWDAEEF